MTAEITTKLSFFIINVGQLAKDLLMMSKVVKYHK